MKSISTSGQRSGFKIFLTALYWLSLIIFVYFLVDGINYYVAPYPARPHHANYRDLRPAGLIGHGLGVIGSAMMIIMLTYSLRKRAKKLQSLGPLSRWLDIHIYFGILGPLLVVLHTSFKVQGLVAVSFWSMIAVAISGILGRYLYLQIPRNIEGGELTIKEIDDLRIQVTVQMITIYGLTEKQVELLEKATSIPLKTDASLGILIWASLKDDLWGAWSQKGKIKQLTADLKLPSATRKNLWQTLRRKSILERRVLLLSHMQRIFHYWHVIHKPFAIIMYLIMVIHIIVAVSTGYKWIF